MRGRRFINLMGANKAAGLSSYLGQVATRTIVPNIFSASFQWKQNRRAHIARQAITSLQAVFANFWVNSNTGGFPLNTELGSGAVTSITASIEYPAGTFTQVKFSSSATGSIPNLSYLVADAVSVSIPSGATFWVNQWEHNTAGIVFMQYNVNPKFPANDFFQFSATALTDQTMTGITASTGNEAGTNNTGCVALIANTVLPSLYLLGDSRCQGTQDIPTASLDVGELARCIGGSFAYINGGTNGDFASAFVASHTNRLALSQYCSHVIVEAAINDMFAGGATAAATAASRQAIFAMFSGKPVFETTVPPETTSSDGWTSATQSPANPAAETQRLAFNASVRAGSTGVKGFFDFADAAETARNSGIWKFPGDTPDGVHETAQQNLASLAAGVINTALIVRGPPAAPSAAAVALFARMTNQPTAARKTLINNLIVLLQSAGVWAKLDTFYALAAADSQAASLNWVANQYNLTAVNSPAFAVDTGYTGDGTTSFLDTGFTPSTAPAPNYLINSASIFVRSNTNARLDGSPLTGGGALATLNPWNAANNFGTIGINGVAIFAGTPTTTKGLFTLSRQSSAAFSAYQDGNSLGSNASASTGVSAASIRLLGDSGGFSTRQVSAGGFGAGLSAADVSTLAAAVTAYLNALGVS